VRADTPPEPGRQRFQFTLRFLLALTCLVALVLGCVSAIASEPEHIPFDTEEILLLACCPLGALVGFILGKLRRKRGILGGMLGGAVFMAAAATILQPRFAQKWRNPFPVPFTERYLFPILLLTALGTVAGALLGVVLHLMLKLDAPRWQRDVPRVPVKGSRGRRLCKGAVWVGLLAAGLGAACWWLAPFGWRERATLTGHNGPPVVAFAPDSRTLASACTISYSGVEDHTLRLWDVATRQMQLSLELPGYGNAVIFSPEGDKLITWCWSAPHLSVWDISTRREIAKLPLGWATNSFHWMRFSGDGKTLFTSEWRPGAERLLRWDPGTWKVRSSFQVPRSNPSAVSPDGTAFATIDEAGTVTLWEVPSGRRIKTLRGSRPPFAGTPSPSEPTFSPDGNWLAAGSSLWNVRTGAVREIPGGALGFTPDSKSLVVVKELEGRPWSNFPPLWLHDTAILGKMLAPRQYSKLVIVDVATGGILAVSRPTHRVGWAALSPDGTTIATGGSRGDIKLWDNPVSKR
jgi:WD40 repeat protein